MIKKKHSILEWVCFGILFVLLLSSSIKGERLQTPFFPQANEFPFLIQELVDYSWPLIIGSLFLLSVSVIRFFKLHNKVMLSLCMGIFNLKILFEIKNYLILPNNVLFIVSAGVLFAATFFIPIAIFNLLKNKLNPLWVIYFLIIFGVVFAVLSLIQIYYNPLSAIWQNRFNGIAPHPIFASIIYSVTLSSSLALLSIDKSKFYWYLASIFFLVLLILTGSRSGLLLFVLQSITFFLLGLILEKKISYISVILFFNLAVLVGVFVVLFPDAFADLGFRSISSKDTRTEVWTSLFGSFLDSPWEGSELNKSSENTYLLFLSRLGIVFLPLLLFILMHFSIMTGSLYKRVESFHPTMSLEAKVIFKYQFSLFFGFFVLAVFEGFGSDLMSYSVIILLISTGTLGYFYDEYA